MSFVAMHKKRAFVRATATSLDTVLFARYLPSHFLSAITTAVMAPLILVCAELLPKSIARGHPQHFTPWPPVPLAAAQLVLLPVVSAVSSISTGLLRLLDIKDNPHTISAPREEVHALANISAEHGIIGPLEHRMIRRVFDLNHTPLSAALVLLVEFECLPTHAPLQDALQHAAQISCALPSL